MSTGKNIDLESWAKKATQRLQDKLVIKHRTLYIPSLDDNIVIRNLTNSEVIDISEMDTSKDTNRGDKCAVYTAIIEPDMRILATKLKDDGAIVDYYDVCDMFDMHELNSIAKQVMELSGVTGKNKVTVVDELKN